MQLDRTTKRVLKYIRNHPEVSIDTLKEVFGSTLCNSVDLLLEEDLIYQPIKSIGGGKSTPAHCYSISAKGKSYYQYRFRNAVFRITPLIISLLSLLISVISIILNISKSP